MILYSMKSMPGELAFGLSRPFGFSIAVCFILRILSILLYIRLYVITLSGSSMDRRPPSLGILANKLIDYLGFRYANSLLLLSVHVRFRPNLWHCDWIQTDIPDKDP